MSCKGISVTAARELADQMCAEYDIPLYLLTDFDKSGFSGAGTFERDNRRYTYQNEIEVVRLGLRLADVQEIARARGVGIEDFWEEVFDKGSAEARRANLKLNGATDAEADFLLHHRVELNALRSDELVAFVERKLEENGVRKLVPPRTLLADTYRLFKRGVAIRQLVEQELAKPNAVRFRPIWPNRCAPISPSTRRCRGMPPSPPSRVGPTNKNEGAARYARVASP